MKTGLEDQYVIKNNKKLRKGYTTGTCAAAAAKAAAFMLLTGKQISSVEIGTPKGILLELALWEITIEKDQVTCAIKKDSGDDPDVTNGILVFAKAAKNKSQDITIDGGLGVGRVTKPGLEQPIGSAAINKVPRKMIGQAVREVLEEFEYPGGMDVEIFIPEGVEIAKRTFNPRLGIEGGISILGTSGIVEPMSEAALIESIRIEMKMLAANKKEYLLISPGNYGADFSKEVLGISLTNSIKCSNYVGETIDAAIEFGIKGVLFVSHIGKFIKVAGGIMNTHSRFADARMEILAANAVEAGAPLEVVKEILQSLTTEEGIGILRENNVIDKTMGLIVEKIVYHINKRAYEKLEIGVIIFSNQYGLLGQTKNAEDLLKCLENYTE